MRPIRALLLVVLYFLLATSLCACDFQVDFGDPTPESVQATNTPSASTDSLSVSTFTPVVEAGKPTPASAPTRESPPTSSPDTPSDQTPAVSPTAVAQQPTETPSGPVKITMDNVERVVPVGGWGKGPINEAAWSPDGKTIAIASSYGVYLYDPSSLAQRAFIASAGQVNDMAFSLDSNLLAFGDATGDILIAKSVDGSTVHDWESGAEAVTHIAFSPDGTLLASADGDSGMVLIWRVSDASYMHGSRVAADTIWRTYYITNLSFSHDGSVVAAAYGMVSPLYLTGSSGVVAWRVADGAELHKFTGFTGPVNRLAFSPDGSLLVAGSGSSFRRGRDNVVRVWRLSDWALVRELQIEHASQVDSVAFSPDGNLLAAGYSTDVLLGTNRSLAATRLWRVSDWALLNQLEGHDSAFIQSMAFSPDGTRLVSTSYDDSVILWRVKDGAKLYVLKGHTGYLEDAIFSPDGTMLFSYDDNEDLRLWRVSDGTSAGTLADHSGAVSSVSFSPDGHVLGAASSDGSLELWNVRAATRIHDIRADTGHGYVHSVAYSRAGALLASSGDDGTVRIWHAATGELARELKLTTEDSGTLDSLGDVAFSPDSTTIATIANLYSKDPDSYVVKLWRVDDGRWIRDLVGHKAPLSNIAFSPDGSLLASGSGWGGSYVPDGETEDNSVRLWKSSDGSQVRELNGHTSAVNSVMFSPDGSLLASGSEDETVKLWRVSDGILTDDLSGHGASVRSVDFSPDGTLLASGAGDLVRVWRVSDGELMHVLSGHRGTVASVVFSPDGTLLASGSYDGTVKLWAIR